MKHKFILCVELLNFVFILHRSFSSKNQSINESVVLRSISSVVFRFEMFAHNIDGIQKLIQISTSPKVFAILQCGVRNFLWFEVVNEEEVVID